MRLQSTSTLALLVVNLLPIVGVLAWDWDVRSIVTLYWSENLILGGIMLVKMLVVSGPSGIPNMLFFLIHYGAFCGGHGVFINELFPSNSPDELGALLPSMGPFNLIVEPVTTIFGEAGTLWWWAFVALAVSHLVSFGLNWLGQGEYKLETKGSLMTAPYRRIMVLHVAVLLGGVAISELGEPVYLVIVLVLVKIAVDLLMHRREHGAPGRAFATDGNLGSLPEELTVPTASDSASDSDSKD